MTSDNKRTKLMDNDTNNNNSMGNNTGSTNNAKSVRDKVTVVEHSKDDPIGICNDNPTKSSGEPFTKESYKSSCQKTSHAPMQDKSTFLILKEIMESKDDNMDISDDGAITEGNNRNPSCSCRMNIFFSIPKEETEETGDNIDEAVKAMNGMIKPLINAIPSIRLVPWLSTPATIKKREYLKKLP